jgi:hypothetical protein
LDSLELAGADSYEDLKWDRSKSALHLLCKISRTRRAASPYS